jgi:hypothetical protein
VGKGVTEKGHASQDHKGADDGAYDTYHSRRHQCPQKERIAKRIDNGTQ